MSGENKNHDDTVTDTSCDGKADINRRAVLLGSSSLVAAATLTSQASAGPEGRTCCGTGDTSRRAQAEHTRHLRR